MVHSVCLHLLHHDRGPPGGVGGERSGLGRRFGGPRPRRPRFRGGLGREDAAWALGPARERVHMQQRQRRRSHRRRDRGVGQGAVHADHTRGVDRGRTRGPAEGASVYAGQGVNASGNALRQWLVPAEGRYWTLVSSAMAGPQTASPTFRIQLTGVLSARFFKMARQACDRHRHKGAGARSSRRQMLVRMKRAQTPARHKIVAASARPRSSPPRPPRPDPSARGAPQAALARHSAAPGGAPCSTKFPSSPDSLASAHFSVAPR
mmetsp:Transcript_44069/g.128299  ORF Transcript_44069/g.128299 Transcript_44069/m.128299 type:complete len:263 (-) Transcript_44069:79-867(-)